jgi:large subunit ribosomal protein L22
MPETAARLRHHRTSPTKVRQVLRLIVGKDVADAREILRFCERGPAETVMKLLDSAVANAEHNDSVPEEELFVTRAFADEGPTMKRWRPRARGRGTRIRKRTSHITIIVARYEDDALEQRRKRELLDEVEVDEAEVDEVEQVETDAAAEDETVEKPEGSEQPSEPEGATTGTPAASERDQEEKQ